MEFEGTANPADPLTLGLGVTWLDATYQEFLLSSVGDLSGRSVAGVPNWTVVVSGQWAQPLSNGDELVLRSTFLHESETNIVEGLPGFISRGEGAAIAAADQFTREANELSASVTYVMAGTGVELSVWGRNLLNNRHLLSVFDSVAQPFAVSGYTNQPRTYGVGARYRF